MYSRVLVPLDGSVTAEKVLPYARYLAAKLEAPVELLAVVDVAEAGAHTRSENARFFDTIIEEGVRHYTDYLRGIAATVQESEVRCSVQRGRPEEVIIERAAADPGLLVTMATHGRSGLNRFLLGSVAEKVLRGTTNPLLLVRATNEGRSRDKAAFTSILVPLDGSELAEHVLPTVTDLAKRLDLEVELFRAYHIPYNLYADDWGVAENAQDLVDSARKESEQYLEGKANDLKNLGVGKVSWVAKEGIAEDEIIKLGRGSANSLIAMCSHGRSGVKRWVLGSVTEVVARHSAQPVLIIRAAG